MKFLSISLLVMISISQNVLSNEINLHSGDSIYINAATPTLVTCEKSREEDLQSVTTKTCGHIDTYGDCDFFNTTTITGRYCIQGKTCGHIDTYGGCNFFNTTGACGNYSCSKDKECAYIDIYGDCTFFNINISCY